MAYGSWFGPGGPPGQFSGYSLNYLRVAVGEGGLEFRSPAQVLSDIGASADTHVHVPPATPRITRYTAGSGTHTLVGSPRWLRIRMVAGGGGGQGSGTTPGNGGNGGDTSFGLWTAIKGNGGAAGTGGTGGTGGVDSTGTLVTRFAGTRGADSRAGYTNHPGGPGGGTAFGSAAFNAASGGDSNASQAGPPNTGVGGSGGASDATAPFGAGGGGGEYAEFIITSPSPSYSFAVGAAGTAGIIGGGTLPRAGSAGQAGVIIIEEHYV